MTTPPHFLTVMRADPLGTFARDVAELPDGVSHELDQLRAAAAQALRWSRR